MRARRVKASAASELGASTGEIVWRTERRRLGDLLDWELNPRQLTEKQEAALAASLQRFGYVEEIVVNADGRSIIGGHMRRKVALARRYLEPGALVDVRIPSRPLSEDERAELAIRLNRNSGEWDFDALSSFDVDSLIAWGFEAAELGVGELVEPAVTAPAEPALSAEVVIEVRCSRRDLEAFRETLDEWGTRDGVTVNVAT